MFGLSLSVAAVAGLTVLMMLIEHQLGRADKSASPVHYGHSDVGDHEYEDLEPHHRPQSPN